MEANELSSKSLIEPDSTPPSQVRGRTLDGGNECGRRCVLQEEVGGGGGGDEKRLNNHRRSQGRKPHIALSAPHRLEALVELSWLHLGQDT